MTDDAANDAPIFCHRCALQLSPGDGRTYIVHIEAMADPTPPIIKQEDLDQDFDKEAQILGEQLSGLSQQELADQVHRRLTLSLCISCYEQWIENPTG